MWGPPIVQKQQNEIASVQMWAHASVTGWHFPAGIRVTRPEGGFVLWLELPPEIDSTELAQAALEDNISIAPGAMFSTTGKYHHHIRLSCAVRWNERVERALIRLGELIKDQRDGGRWNQPSMPSR
jgi:DNA-binding transcriptional MocR family regulator